MRIGTRQQGYDAAQQRSIRKGRQVGADLVPDLDTSGHGLGYRRIEPDTGQPVDQRQILPGFNGHPGAYLQGLELAADRCGEGLHCPRFAAAANLLYQRLWHAEQAEALLGRSDQAGVTGTQYREELQLRGGPLGNQQVDQGCSSWQYIARGTPVNPLDESASAGLEVRYLSLVIGQGADHLDIRGQYTADHRRGPHSEVLHGLSGDAQDRRILLGSCVFRDKLHIHER